MKKQQIILSLVGVLAVVLIYQLPRVVVENETNTNIEPKKEAHDFSITPEDQDVFSSLTQLLKGELEIKKSVNFADSLAKLHLKYQQVDSASLYAGYILEVDSGRESLQKAASLYYRAFQLSPNADQAAELAVLARGALEQLLVDDPQNNMLKNKLAMTLMTTENPMAGIQMLREVLADDPENREATLNLGLLAIRSGQYDRAKERFQALLDKDSTDSEATLYYGVSLMETGDQEEARRFFEKIINQTDVDPAIKATASSFIEEL